VLGTAKSRRRVLEAVVDDLAGCDIGQGGHGGVVGVEDHRRRGVGGLQGAAPARRHRVHLAVAVQLVPEEVGEEEDAGPQSLHGLGQGRLVHLEDAEAAGSVAQPSPQVGLSHESRGDAPHKVGAAAVRQGLQARRRGHARYHPGSGGLAVGAGDDEGAGAKL
jgi:hypothetical protein